MIYDQGKDGACTAFAIANAVEASGGRILSRDEVLEIFKEAGKGNRLGGAQLSDCLEEFKKRGIIKDYTCVYQVFRERGLGKVVDLSIRRTPLIFGMRIREGKPSIPLDEHFIYRPNTGKVRGFHAVCMTGLKTITLSESVKKTLAYYVLENSWGEDWGDHGVFYMKRSDFQSEITVAYQIHL